jgi:PAS domain-containing protein
VTLSEPVPGEEDLQDLYENAPCGYLSLRTDGRIFKANLTFCSWTGYEPGELVRKKLSGRRPFYANSSLLCSVMICAIPSPQSPRACS